MTNLEIRLLGPPDVKSGGGPVLIPRRRTRALLFYLAATRCAHSRAHLATRFWGDASDREAGRSLSDTLYRLREALSQPACIATRGDQIWLDRETGCWVDLVAFETRLAAARRAGASHEAASQALESATDLWRGTLLEGFDLPDCPEFEDWLALERQRVETLYLDALAELCERHTRAGSPERALHAAERLLHADPLREDAHRWLMRLRAASGNRAVALRQYELARAVLERELGVAPAPETETLRNQIARGEITAAPGASEAAAMIPAPAVPPTRLRASPALPLIGRDGTLEVLRAHLEAARGGSGKTVLVSGEAGIGKSRLLSELLSGAAADVRVLSAGCHETSRDMAFQPLIEALRAAVRPAEFATLGLPPLLWQQLCRLLPELSAATASISDVSPPAPALPGWARGQLFEALARVLVALARRMALVLALDDLHDADEATLLFLAYLDRRLASQRILVVGTYRDDEAGRVLRQTVRELARQGLVAQVLLERLSSDETVRLVAQLAGGHPNSESLGRMLHQESAGNPLFITEMLHSLGEAGFLRHDAQGYLIPPDPATFSQSAVALPRSLRDLIAGRLVRLSAAARQALAGAATLGPDLDDDLLQRTIGWDEEQTVAALEELLQAHLLVEAPGGSYRFSHEKIRGVAYADLAEARRTLLHRRAGEALAARHAAPDLLAYHFARGKAWRRAHQYAVVAAERAVEAHANREATVHYTTALEAATHLSGEVEPSRLAAIHEARGRVWLGMSEYAAAIDDFERALEEARRAGDERRALSAQRYLALARFWHHEPAARALGYAEGALAEARRLGDRHEVAACSAVLAAILVTRGRLREGISRVEEAIRVGRETGDDYLVADAVGTLGMAHGWRGSFHQARSELAQSLELARVRHWGLLIPRALFFTGLNTAMAGDYQAALDFLTECRRYAEEMNDRWWLARLPNTFGWVYQELYDIGTSRRYDAEGVEAARESPWPEPLGNALVNLAMDWLLSGELGHAQDAFDQAAELLGRDETMQWRWETRLWLGLAEWWLARGDAEHALAFAGRALTLARQTRAAKNAMKARRLQGLALLASGHLDTATNALTRAARLADCLNAPRLRWETHALLARLGQQAGRDAEAERHIRIAGGLVDAVARTLKDEALRARFLGAEPLRDLFAGLR